LLSRIPALLLVYSLPGICVYLAATQPLPVFEVSDIQAKRDTMLSLTIKLKFGFKIFPGP
jgi:hypothetical protein